MSQTANRYLAFFIAIMIATGLACNAFTEDSAPGNAAAPDEALLAAAVAKVEARLAGGGTTTVGDSGESVEVPVGMDLILEDRLVTLYEKVNPSVVHIVATLGSGSGFVFDNEGHIVTNNHVVADAGEFEVIFVGGERRRGQVVGTDVDSDLAVILVEDLPPGIPPVELGDSGEVQVGQLVATIGNPFGEEGSMSLGIISGLGRSLSSARLGYSLPQVLQTDAPINPGNSGGPLLDLEGRVIGVNTAIRSTTGVNTGVGFAVPVNAVHRIVPALIANGSYVYPYMGIEVPREPLNLASTEELGLPQSTGAYVTGVRPGSPAEEAGLIGRQGPGGDLIIAVDDMTIIEFNDLLGYLVFETEVGQTIALTVLRDGETLVLPLTLGERP
jgi:2-alkenal reductase